MNSSFLQENDVTFSFLFKIKIVFALSPLGFLQKTHLAANPLLQTQFLAQQLKTQQQVAGAL